MIVRRLSFAAIAAALAAAATAQPADPIKVRQELMKENGRDLKAAVAMLKGETPYDQAKAVALFKDMNDVASKFGNYFPKGSETGGDTEAAPAIWSKPADFKAAVAKFQKDTAAAAAANPATVAEFTAQFQTVSSNCKSCHEAFRIKKN
jgi:cytochrome c556